MGLAELIWISATGRPCASVALQCTNGAGGTKVAQTYFDDPALDRLVAVTVSLAAEVQVLRDRQRALEAVLERHGIPVAAQIERWEPDEAQRRELEAEDDLYVRAVLGPLAAEER